MPQKDIDSPSEKWQQRLLSLRNVFLLNKKRRIVSAVVIFVLFVMIVPATRNALLSTFVKKEISLLVYDANGAAIHDAEVIVGQHIYRSSDTGLIRIASLSVGKSHVVVSRPFYKTLKTHIDVPVFGAPKQYQLTLQPNGNIVKLKVVNRLSNAPLEGVSIRSHKGGNAKTNRDGVAVLALPLTAKTSDATLEGDGIVSQTVVLHAAADALTNNFKATPKGKVYFLARSKNGIDVIKSNLDGSERQVAVEGAGSELASDTTLVPANDWSYIALRARHNGPTPSLYVFSTKDDALKTLFEDASQTTVIGWVGKYLIYKEETSSLAWANSRTLLKSYNAESGETTVLDRTRAEGANVLDYAGEFFGDIYTFHDKLVYTKYWTASYYYGARLADKRMAVVETRPDSTQPRTVRVWQAGYNAFIRTAQDKPESFLIYIRLDGVLNSYWSYTKGEVSENASIDDSAFTNTKYPIFKVSPNGTYAAWLQTTNRTQLVLGDARAENSKGLYEGKEYLPYGWYSNDYLLLRNTKNELFAIGRDGIKPGDAPIKIGSFLPQPQKLSGYSY